VNTQEPRWRFDREVLAIREDTPKGMALFEVLSATSDRQANAAALAPEMEQALRKIEWGGMDMTDEPEEHCPCCYRPRDVGHFESCELRAILDRLDARQEGTA